MSKKILATLGPLPMSEDIITGCADFVVYLFRINLSHTSLDTVAPTIEKIRAWTDLSICLDSEGGQDSCLRCHQPA